ncbi:unnamed protein product [Cyclocybe aegerita]|uniref:Uncharacterized protein n=1 Tax=Cyclocybe aegerita TaxID=1973307 RepID=A0A8S0VSU8_CYCAE|nr:unnamed protein product [Cyclocybe aegerita]
MDGTIPPQYAHAGLWNRVIPRPLCLPNPASSISSAHMEHTIPPHYAHNASPNMRIPGPSSGAVVGGSKELEGSLAHLRWAHERQVGSQILNYTTLPLTMPAAPITSTTLLEIVSLSKPSPNMTMLGPAASTFPSTMPEIVLLSGPSPNMAMPGPGSNNATSTIFASTAASSPTLTNQIGAACHSTCQAKQAASLPTLDGEGDVFMDDPGVSASQTPKTSPTKATKGELTAASIKRLKNMVRTLEGRIAVMASHLENGTPEIAEKMSTLENRVTELATNIASTQAPGNQASAMLAHIESTIARLTTSNNEIVMAVQALQANEGQVMGTLSSVDARVGALNARIQDLSDMVSAGSTVDPYQTGSK